MNNRNSLMAKATIAGLCMVVCAGVRPAAAQDAAAQKPMSMDMSHLPGNFSVVATQLGILRIDTRNGKTWLLVPGTGDPDTAYRVAFN